MAGLERHGSWNSMTAADIDAVERYMAELTRTLLAVVFTTGVGACGMLTGNQSQGPPIPDPITPAQKATASEANPDSAILADFNARLERFVKIQRALLKRLPLSENATPEEIKKRQET